MLFCIGAVCTVISYTTQLCYADWVFERVKFVEYLNSVNTSCYQAGASGEKGCYDCTGLIYSYFKDRIVDGYKPKYKLNTMEAYNDILRGKTKQVSVDDAKTGDLVLHLPIPWKSDNTHVAVFVRKLDWNKIEILDTFEKRKRVSERVVPYKGNIHKLVIIRNPRIQ
jgi:hypothetical protein